MKILVAGMLMASGGAAVSAQADSAAFIIRLGTDTTAIERYVRSGNQLIAEVVSRSPATVLHRMAYSFDARGRVSGTEYTQRRPGESAPLVRTTIQFQGDSAIIETRQGANPTRTQRMAASDVIPIAGPFYTPYEIAVMRALGGAGSATLLSGSSTPVIRVQRIGRDSVVLNNQFDEPMRAHIDTRGRLLHLHTPAYTTVERMRWVDLDQFAREFAARDAAGKSMGNLSPRVTLRRRVGAANLWLDYGSPRMRGRPVWGGLVPYGRLWRMGANDAAHIATDRTLQIGTVTVQPGTYTLFLMPTTANEWQLVVNRASAISGLDHDAAQDIGRTALTLSPRAAPSEAFQIDIAPAQGAGGVLSITWDRMTATVPIQVR
ncbi:MAG: DUF2911 domain-containing protein [Gemmatimonadota bacterium]